MKREMTFEEIMEKDHYRSIINLTLHYQLKQKDKFEGLRAIHYRWALCPNHDGLDGSLFKETLHKFFGSDLKKLYKEKKVIKNSVTTKKNLSNFLRQLSKKGLLNKRSKENTPFYFVSLLLHGYINKAASLAALQTYNPVSVQHFPDALNDKMVNAEWFGCPELMSKYMSKVYGSFDLEPEDKEFIEDNLAKMFIAASNIFDRFDKVVDGGMHPMNFVIEVGPPCDIPVMRKQFRSVFKKK